MGDITCGKCGEPWGHYAMRHNVGDWDGEPDDAWEQFRAGEGCPVCDWGEKAGDVSRSRAEDEDDLQREHLQDVLREDDGDPIERIHEHF
jgi:hypothetical protein